VSQRRNGLRRFSSSSTLLVLGLLVAFLLPLHGIADAAGSILSPAHYHSRAQHHDVPSPDIRVHPSGVNHADVKNLAAGRHGHEHASSVSREERLEDHEQHSPPHSQHDDRKLSSEHLDDDHDDAHQGQPSASIGRHTHVLSAADVVYVDDDSESPERSAASKTTSLNADTVLPGWWMASMPVMGAQILPEPGCDFDSLPAAPLMRPPSAETLHA